jgi:hypothetical protein
MMKRNYLFSDNHDKSVSFDDKEHFDSLGHTIYYSTVVNMIYYSTVVNIL